MFVKYLEAIFKHLTRDKSGSMTTYSRVCSHNQAISARYKIKFMFNLVYRVNGKPVKILVELI